MQPNPPLQSATQLPIYSVLNELISALRTHPSVVLSAAPGAGKTTVVPLALLDAGLADTGSKPKKILMLEPRRLAAMRSAQYMATQLGENVGERVGYRVRGDNKVSARTRIEVVTEAILTRQLQSDPELADVACVIFDEFHERSLHADLGLALCLEVQRNLREDLKILVMSATLDGLVLSGLLAHGVHAAPIISSTGRSYPVRLCYAGFEVHTALEQQVASTVKRALREEVGDVLVFLPGQREIGRTQNLLTGIADADGTLVQVHALFGEASFAQQQAALTPDKNGARKIILATSIAETSLTIDGVRIVVDAGLARASRFDPRRGMAGLVTQKVSQASAEQRRGRAGRQAPGACYRLWHESQHGSLARFAEPEILQSDLAPLALELALWGAHECELSFLDAPAPAHMRQARQLLRNLSALDAHDKITAHGRALAALPVHPRYAHMLVRAQEFGQGALACDVAALLDERSLSRGRDSGIDLHTQYLILKNASAEAAQQIEQRAQQIDHGARKRAQQQARRLRQLLRLSAQDERDADENYLGLMLALAYPERVAQRRDASGERWQMASGIGAQMRAGSVLGNSAWIAIAELDGEGVNARIFLADAVELSDLQQHLPELCTDREQVQWSPREEIVIARRVQRFGALTIGEQSLNLRASGKALQEQVRAAMLTGIRAMGLSVLPWTPEQEQWLARCRWLQSQGLPPADWPDSQDAALLAELEQWLAPFLDGVSRRAHLAQIDLSAALHARLPYSARAELDRLAPTHWTAPTGTKVALDYQAEVPVLAVRLQEVFGLQQTPMIGGGKIPLLVHLLSPARKPLAVTQDLASFWRNAYADVRKDMRGQYPRHYWPEDPLQAEPTKRTKAADDRARKA